MPFIPLNNRLSVQTSQAPSGDDYLFVRGLETRISFEDLLAMTKFALTNSVLKPGDPRINFVEDVRQIQFVAGEEGKRLEFPAF